MHFTFKFNYDQFLNLAKKTCEKKFYTKDSLNENK